MPKYLITGTYSSGSWARMIQNPGDRIGVAKTVAESVGSSVEAMYWDLESRSALIICDLPDAVTAAAVVTTGNKTGAFANVRANELLTQDQLTDWLLRARDTSQVYEVPGQFAVDRT